MKYYRLISGPNPIGVHPLLPGGLTRSYTGFWSPHKECIKNLINDHDQYVFEQTGGTLWPDELTVLEIDQKDVKTSSEEAKKLKENHNPRYDKDEVFVTELLKEPQSYSWRDWMSHQAEEVNKNASAEDIKKRLMVFWKRQERATHVSPRSKRAVAEYLRFIAAKSIF